MAYKDIYALAVVGSSIFAGTYNDSLYRTTNNGVNWIPVNNGINQYVISLTAVGTNIFAGTKIYSGQGEYGKSVWRRSYSEIIGIQNISNEIPSSFALHQNYPNPFNPVTNIRYAIPKSGFVKLVIFDLLGRGIETLVNESLQPGTYEVTFDGSRLPSGVYFYRLTADGYVETKKMLMIK